MASYTIQQINQYVQDIELMTSKTKHLLCQMLFIGAVLLSIIFSIVLKIIGLVIIAGSSISTPLFYIAKYLIEKNAAERAIAFINRLNAQYNGGSRLTTIMPITWTGELTEMFRCGLKVRLAALFADNALIILEINDALSDLTANIVHVNIPHDATFPNNFYPNTAYPNEITINNAPFNN
ncbi:19015_t:CDS:2, partial [Gigaspora margarita]